VDIPKPEKPYIVLEIMKKKSKEEGKIFKFITFKNKAQINIGRKKDVDVRISEDISVSRIHAILRYKHENREFTLEDNHSKFGTLVLAKSGLLLRPHHPNLTIQIGAELYEF
jgi:pSer/pThr/pTyr-binding forkhead associated (FHA) protein